jgi:hypothetical protein
MLPEGAPLTAKALLHLGSRAATDQALSRLTRHGKLMRSGRGMYVRPIESRFGTRAPSPEKVVTETARLRGETVAPHGAAAANRLGLTTQVPMRTIYLTSGRSRRLNLGAQSIELEHAPRWQLTNAARPVKWCGRLHGLDVRRLTSFSPELSENCLKRSARNSSLLEVLCLNGWRGPSVPSSLRNDRGFPRLVGSRTQ